MTVERSEIDAEECSLCEDCAPHPALRRFIAANWANGPVCGVCFRDPDEAAYRVADPTRFDALSNLVKALIRYEYDEVSYNSHFGADLTASSLLSEANPIIEHASAAHERSALDSEPFLMRLVADVYPPYDSGVALHAGYSDGEQNTLLEALKHGQSAEFAAIRKRIASENYYAVEPAAINQFEAIGDRIDSVVPAGTAYYRARVGVEDRYYSFDMLGVDAKVRSKPYEGALLGAPPPPLTRGGRLNRAGVSFLYLASDSDTAAAEMRPHPGHQLSVGMFRARRDIRLANFNVEIDAFAGSDQQLDLFSFVLATDHAMSLPVVPEAAGRYPITQLIADVARQRSFDGVAFKSSVGPGQNVCIFDPGAFEYVAGSAEVRRVVALRYELAPVEVVLVPGSGDRRIGG